MLVRFEYGFKCGALYLLRVRRIESDTIKNVDEIMARRVGSTHVIEVSDSFADMLVDGVTQEIQGVGGRVCQRRRE